MRCPICQQPIDPAGDYRPFCSERCKLIDLGNWLSGRYRILSPIREPADQLLAQEAVRDDLVKDPVESDPERAR